MRADREFVVAWSGVDPDFEHISGFARRYTADGFPQDAPFPLNQPIAPSGFAIPQALAMNAAGDLVAVWVQGVGDAPTTVQARRFNAAGIAQGGEFTVAKSTSSENLLAANVAAAMDGTGKFVVVYGRFSSAGRFGFESVGIFGHRYNARGVSRGNEFPISRTTRVQFRNEISADMDTNGNFVVAWIANRS